MTWDPACYARFAEERRRPGLDLLARLALESPRRIVDLGCGTGELTRELARRWPEAAVEGIDASEAMLEKAQAGSGNIAWRCADIGRWRPSGPLDLIFSNAALHWLPEHDALFPRLIGWLAEDGVLAAQMPRNDDSPARRAVGEAIAGGPWRARLAAVWCAKPVAPPEFYLDLLAPLCRGLELWETIYYHRLEGPNPVAAWLAGTTLRPLFAVLEGAEREAFEGECFARLAAAYPRRADGATVFPFRRLFVLARK